MCKINTYVSRTRKNILNLSHFALILLIAFDLLSFSIIHNQRKDERLFSFFAKYSVEYTRLK